MTPIVFGVLKESVYLLGSVTFTDDMSNQVHMTGQRSNIDMTYLKSVHDVAAYWFYKYIFFGLMLSMNVLMIVKYVSSGRSDLIVGFLILLGVSSLTFALFQSNIKRLYLHDHIFVVQGFFYGSSRFDRRELRFTLRKGWYSFGLMSLMVTVKQTGKSHKVIVNSTGLKNLQKSGVLVVEV